MVNLSTNNHRQRIVSHSFLLAALEARDVELKVSRRGNAPWPLHSWLAALKSFPPEPEQKTITK
eukprot:scaffold919_cov96-Skeletonema_dohrnii-CCMP3373.AAC.6